jgi:hypothetical protein
MTLWNSAKARINRWLIPEYIECRIAEAAFACAWSLLMLNWFSVVTGNSIKRIPGCPE